MEIFAKRAPLPPPCKPKFPTRLGVCQKNEKIDTKTDSKPDTQENFKFEVVGNNFGDCGQLEVFGPVENLDETSNIYGMKLTDGKCEINVPEFDSMKHWDVVKNDFDECGQLDASGQIEYLEQVSKIYGVKLTDGKSALKVSEVDKKRKCHDEMSVSQIVENFEQNLLENASRNMTAKNHGKCDTGLMTDYADNGKSDTKLMKDYTEMTFGLLKPSKKEKMHCMDLVAVPESKSGVTDKTLCRTTRTPSSISKKRNLTSSTKSKCNFGAKKNFFQGLINIGKKTSCGLNPLEPHFNPFVKALAAVPGHVTRSDQPEVRKGNGLNSTRTGTGNLNK